MLTPEGTIKKEVKNMLDAQGIYYFMPTGIGYCRSGIPDIVACIAGIFVGIEVKAGNKSPTDLQQRELNKIAGSGGTALCINANNIDTLPAFLRNIKLYGLK
jgi:hypothetical protein